MKYTGRYVIIKPGDYLFGPAVAILRITGRVGSTTGEEKTIPIGKGSYEIVLPLNPDIKLKGYIQRVLHTTVFRQSKFLGKQEVLRRLFLYKWVDYDRYQ